MEMEEPEYRARDPDNAWGKPADLPVRFESVAPVGPETVRAFREALEALFDRYPAKLDKRHFVSGEPVAPGDDPREWRATALLELERSDLDSALLFADNTGVPRDELLALAALLGARPCPEG